MYQMPGWAGPKHTRSFTLTGGLMTMEREIWKIMFFFPIFDFEMGTMTS